jgi:hypothetical protein
MKTSSLIMFMAALPAMAAFIPAGSDITVRTMNSIHADGPDENRVYEATIDREVRDREGNVAIPRGANAELVVRRVSGDEMILDLRAVRVQGRRYMLDTEDVVQQGDRDRRDGVGENKRTGKYVGGGAVIGGIIGAIAGGGKGAAIGAASGAAVGAGTQMATRGKSVRVPSEALLTFRLERPVRIAEWRDDRGPENRNNQYRDQQYPTPPNQRPPDERYREDRGR